MNKGILIIAVGNSGYGRLAANLANSIKSGGCTLPIQLIYTSTAIKDIKETHLHLFDYLTEIDKSFYKVDDVYEYGYLKCNLDVFSVFEETIYIDADSLASVRRNLNTYEIPYDVCINQNGIYGYNRRHKDNFVDYAWLLKSDFEDFKSNHELLFDEYIYTQTSFIAFKRGEKSTKFFEAVRACFNYIKTIQKRNIKDGKYIKKGTELRKWLSGAVPDEVCFSLGIMLSGIEPYMENFCGFAEWVKNHQRSLNFYIDGFFIISFACGLNPLTPKERKLYDDLSKASFQKTRLNFFRWLDKKNFLTTDLLNKPN